MPEDRIKQTAIWRTLAAMFNADLKSAKPDQIGRLPGFYNMKQKYGPNYPMVHLRKFENRYSTWSAPESIFTDQPATTPAGSPPSSPPPVVKMNTTAGHADRSGFDWAVTADLVKKGWPDDQIRSYLEKRSQKAAARSDDYIGRTIANARKKLRIQ